MTNQSTTTNNTHNLNTTEEAKMTKTITHEQCGIEMTYHNPKRATLLLHIAYIEVKNADGEHLGNIYGSYEDRDLTDAWEKITHGACPICDGWNDGIGHACTASGWSAVTPEEAEEVKEEALRDWNRMVANEKKYLVSIEREDLIVTEVYDTLEEANDCASREWDHLSEHDKKKAIHFSALRGENRKIFYARRSSGRPV